MLEPISIPESITVPIPIPESIPETDPGATILDRFQKTSKLTGIVSDETFIFPSSQFKLRFQRPRDDFQLHSCHNRMTADEKHFTNIEQCCSHWKLALKTVNIIFIPTPKEMVA